MPIHLSHDDWEDKLQKDAPFCPICGRKMKYILGLYGEFYGCIMYPNCSGKRNIIWTEVIEDENEKIIRELFGTAGDSLT